MASRVFISVEWQLCNSESFDFSCGAARPVADHLEQTVKTDSPSHRNFVCNHVVSLLQKPRAFESANMIGCFTSIKVLISLFCVCVCACVCVCSF